MYNSYMYSTWTLTNYTNNNHAHNVQDKYDTTRNVSARPTKQQKA